MPSRQEPAKQAASTSEAARFLQVSPTRVKQLLDAGSLTSVGPKPEGKAYWPRNAPRVTWTSLRDYRQASSSRRRAGRQRRSRGRVGGTPSPSSRTPADRTALLELKIGLDELREELVRQRRSAKHEQADLDEVVKSVLESVRGSARAQESLVRAAVERVRSTDLAADRLEALSEHYATALGDLLVDDDASSL